MSYIVLPSFDVAADRLDAFLAAARADAEASLANEPGCLQFDVCADRSTDPAKVVFYEVYTDREAFLQHLETPHLAAFRDSLSLCSAGPVQFFERLVP